MALKQRAMNKKALEMAAASVKDADFVELFGDDGYADNEKDEEVLEKAQAHAVRRILSLINSKD